jgi:hypothetical protein
MIILVNFATSMNWKKNQFLNPNVQAFTPYFPFERGIIYHLDNDRDIGYLKRDADGKDYKFRISEARGKVLLQFCEVDFQIQYSSQGATCARNIIRIQNYEFNDVMQAVKRNNINQLQTMLTELEFDDLENAIPCVMTRESHTGNTVLHIANNENIYSILFGVFWFSKDTNQLLKFVTQTNALNETPLVNAVQQNNAKMVNMLLNVVKENSPQNLISYVMKRSHIVDDYFTRPFGYSFVNQHGDSMTQIFMEICQHNGNNSAIVHFFMDTIYDSETILHQAADAKNTKLFLFIINVFLTIKEYKKLMRLVMQPSRIQITVLHTLI